MIKTFTVTKIGYTAGVYGCSNEYFNLIIPAHGKKKAYSTVFYGMYGAENRIENIMKEAGYTQQYVVSIYGKLTRKDVPSKCVQSEYQLDKYLPTVYKPLKAKTI